MDGSDTFRAGLLLFGVLSVWPVRRILRRAGLPSLWSLLVLVPLIGHVAVYAILAVRPWPNRPPRPAPPPAKPRTEV